MSAAKRSNQQKNERQETAETECVGLTRKKPVLRSTNRKAQKKEEGKRSEKRNIEGTRKNP